jgi:glucose-1-phosphate cytidylyltransferase
MGDEDLPVLILCGGRGTRAYPDTAELPKPLLTVAGVPILEHVMGIYAAQGHRRFVLAAGYRADMIAERYATPPADLDVAVVDTGLETGTGERIRLAAAAIGEPRFFATYGDGVGNVDVVELLDAHHRMGGLATVTTVPLRSQFGTVVSDTDNRIVEFKEKPILDGHWINAGFFVFEQDAFRYWAGDSLEQDVLPRLAGHGVLFSHRHHGFWKSMDTFKDRQELETLVAHGNAPWNPGAPF